MANTAAWNILEALLYKYVIINITGATKLIMAANCASVLDLAFFNFKLSPYSIHHILYIFFISFTPLMPLQELVCLDQAHVRLRSS